MFANQLFLTVLNVFLKEALSFDSELLFKISLCALQQLGLPPPLTLLCTKKGQRCFSDGSCCTTRICCWLDKPDDVLALGVNEMAFRFC